MSGRLTDNTYGKGRVRLVKVRRIGAQGAGAGKGGVHDVVDLSVQVMLRGDYEATYLSGDNAGVTPTDTMKNTVYALAREHTIDTIESFAAHLASYFVREKTRVTRATVSIAQNPWDRIGTDHGPHEHAFVRGSAERQLVTAAADRRGTEIECGLDGLVVLKTTDSGFTGYERDRFTTLKETDDRIFATSVTASWSYSTPPSDYGAARSAVRRAIIQEFAAHHSLSVQQTLLAIGRRVLAECAHVRTITLKMPNKHCLLVDLSPFGMTNPNEVFVPVDEPHGQIEGTVERA